MNDYPESLIVRPLTTWPGQLTPAHRRERSPFSAPRRATLDALRRELQAVAAVRPVLEVAIPENSFRIDGRPRASARPEHPGVVLSLPHTRDLGPLRYATDRYETWLDNLRAIALGMEALRKVDRYGITRRGEQYAGFRALPPGATAMPAAMSVDEAARVIAELADPHHLIAGMAATLAAGRMVDASYRKAARTAHPDAGGDRATWDRLEQAKRVLDEYGRRT